MSNSTPTATAGQRALPLWVRIAALIAMPLFFLTTFTLCYVSAMHKPTPHDLALTVAGPAAITKQVAADIRDRADGGFDITTTTSTAGAKHAVRDRDAVGAVLIEGTKVTTVIASGGGRVATSVIEAVGTQVAQGLGGTATVVDVSPLTKDDTSGTTLFYFLVLCTTGAFLAIVAISQVIARPRMWAMLLTNVVVAIVIPIVGFSVLSAFAGDYGATFGETAAVIGIGMLYALAVGLFTTMLTRLIGAGAIFVVILLLVGLNFPSAGGSIPEAMLPPFWQGIHSFWIGSGAMEAWRSIVYFGGAQAGRWIGQLAVWFGVIAILTAVVGILTRRKPLLPQSDPEGALAAAAEQGGEVAAVAVA